MRDFRSLRVWEKGHQLTLQIYTVVRTFPSDERFGQSAKCNAHHHRFQRISQKVVDALAMQSCDGSCKLEWVQPAN